MTIQKPYLDINHETIEIATPTMGIWRKVQKIMDMNNVDTPMSEYLNNSIDIIIIAFANPKVTKDFLDNLPLSDILPVVRDIANYFNALTFEKLINNTQKKMEEAKEI